eukprot:2154654-Prymnesium_polylepis.6
MAGRLPDQPTSCCSIQTVAIESSPCNAHHVRPTRSHPLESHLGRLLSPHLTPRLALFNNSGNACETSRRLTRTTSTGTNSLPAALTAAWEATAIAEAARASARLALGSSVLLQRSLCKHTPEARMTRCVCPALLISTWARASRSATALSTLNDAAVCSTTSGTAALAAASVEGPPPLGPPDDDAHRASPARVPRATGCQSESLNACASKWPRHTLLGSWCIQTVHDAFPLPGASCGPTKLSHARRHDGADDARPSENCAPSKGSLSHASGGSGRAILSVHEHTAQERHRQLLRTRFARRTLSCPLRASRLAASCSLASARTTFRHASCSLVLTRAAAAKTMMDEACGDRVHSRFRCHVTRGRCCSPWREKARIHSTDSESCRCAASA